MAMGARRAGPGERLSGRGQQGVELRFAGGLGLLRGPTPAPQTYVAAELLRTCEGLAEGAVSCGMQVGQVLRVLPST